jgi:hypothetical protein
MTSPNLHENIKKKVDTLTKNQHVEILKIIVKNPNNKINENRNGIYVNMSFLSESTVDEIATYLKYVEDQQNTIAEFEKQQEELKTSFNC